MFLYMYVFYLYKHLHVHNILFFYHIRIYPGHPNHALSMRFLFLFWAISGLVLPKSHPLGNQNPKSNRVTVTTGGSVIFNR